MNSYKLKLTALTPIHIGTGEVYEPTNFVIDDGYLYEFDEVLFVKSLDNTQKSIFMNLALEDDRYSFVKIHEFIKNHTKEIKKIASNKIRVSRAIENKYRSLTSPVQIERHRDKVFNKFEIQKTLRQPNNVVSYIPATSLKGAISTAYQEYILKKNNKRELKKLFEKQKIFKNLSLADTLYNKTKDLISYATNKERFETDDNSQISTFVEVILDKSEFLTTLQIKNLKDDDKQEIKHKITKENIIQSCNKHYLPLWRDMFKESNINFKNSFINQFRNLQLKENKFLIKVGKYSGARAVTIDGLRKILIKLCQIQNKRDEGRDEEKRIERLYKKSHFETTDEILNILANINLLNDDERRKYNQALDFLQNPSRLERLVRRIDRLTINAILKEETTLWLFDELHNDSQYLSFGWVLCEFIDDETYKQLSKEFSEYENSLIDIKNSRQKEIKQTIQEAKEEALRIKKEKEQKALEEQKRKEEEKRKKQEELSKMSPLDRKIIKLKEDSPNPNETIDIIIFNAIKNGKLDEFKCEVLKRLKEEMIKLKKWVEISKKPQKDKKYKRTQEVIKMLNEYC